jgi:hypothetical protein
VLKCAVLNLIVGYVLVCVMSSLTEESRPSWQTAEKLLELGKTPCKFYPRGKCTKGEKCLFLHATKSLLPRKRRPPDPTTTLCGPKELTSILESSLLTQWRGDGMHHEYLQGFHPRKAIMNPCATSKLLDLINCNSKRNPSVLDPFIGSGTTAVECLRRGWSVFGTDISPTAIGIARSHTWLPSLEEIEALKRVVKLVVDEFSSKSISLENTKATTSTLKSIIDNEKSQLSSISTININMIENTLWFLLDYEENRKDLITYQMQQLLNGLWLKDLRGLLIDILKNWNNFDITYQTEHWLLD